MKTDHRYTMTVIGSGAAGMMAALRGVLNNDEVLVFPGNAKDKKKSRDKWVGRVENMPDYAHYKKGIEGPNKETLEWINQSSFAQNLFWQKNKSVVNITKLETGDFLVEDDKGDQYYSKYIIVCTGVMDVQPSIKGSIKPILPFANNQTVDYCLRCDGHHLIGKNGAVIGHDSGAAWVAVMLYERYLGGTSYQMKLLTNGRSATLSADVAELLSLYNIEVIEAEITNINGNDREELESIVFSNGQNYQVGLAFVSEGMIVYNQLLKNLGAELDERGFVITDENGQSSIDGVYVAGDLRAKTKKQIYTAWDNAVTAADHVNMRSRNEKRKIFKERREWPKNLNSPKT